MKVRSRHVRKSHKVYDLRLTEKLSSDGRNVRGEQVRQHKNTSSRLYVAPYSLIPEFTDFSLVIPLSSADSTYMLKAEVL